ncbi:uncharacterized protein LOC34622834 [Cyclospora cayetanensis]|uniref:Uncharacterized protein LOC34622834 n=1 Tax=Cyclospora cayetanensis TaxID=88456 RepID=A0A6P6RZT8_9EIME|nr:uncharacterized protein LOC34622834 [Cyclospora cayetanensis]
MDYQSLDFPHVSKIKHAIGAILLLTALVLYIYGTNAPAIRITVFSFVLPVTKFIVITATLVAATCCRRRPFCVSFPLNAIKVLLVLCKYQLVDVFSVILLRAMHVTKVMSCVATAVGDIAMPDVQSIGLLTAYLIMNNVDFFGARLPSASRRQPTGGLEALLWNFNGFWAMVAFGISASQVHRLSTSFTYTFQCLSMDNMQASDCQSPTSSAADVVLQRSPLCDDVGSLASKRRPTTRAEDTLSVEPTEHAAPADPLQATPVSFPVHARGLNRTYRKRLFRLLFHGCVRIVISVTLLLPVWLQPLEVVDVDLGIVNKELSAFLEYASPLLKDVLPQSLGDCAANEHLAPQPCAGSGPLAVIRTTTYEATARWLAGLKTTQLNVIRFDAAPRNRIVLKIEGIIKSLSLSLRVGECLFGEEPGACPVVWDGTDACCDGSVSFIFQMAVECVSSFPYLSRPTLLRTHISKLVVKEKILGIFPIDVADITRTVEDRVSDWARIYLDSQHKWVHWINGETTSLIERLNLLLCINAPAGLRCPRLD